MGRILELLTQNAALIFSGASGATINVLFVKPGWRQAPADWLICFLVAVFYGPVAARVALPALHTIAPWIPALEVEKIMAAVVVTTGICGVLIVKVLTIAFSKLGAKFLRRTDRSVEDAP